MSEEYEYVEVSELRELDDEEYEVYDEFAGKWVSPSESNYIKFGFPFPDKADNPITAVTIQDMYADQYYVYGTQDYTPKTKNVKYFHCENEEALLGMVIEFIHKERPDIITGWNTEFFDIPYIINRAKKILPKDFYLRLSPVGAIEKQRDKYTGEENKYNIIGVSHVDYMRMYKLPKFQPIMRESYALNFVCKTELGEEKVAYQSSLSDLYDTDYERFIDYNIRDCELVYLLNCKLKFLELIMTMAYMAKVNVEDAFGSVKIWEIFVYNELKSKHMVMSPRQKHPFKKEFPGGYVKQPSPGMKEWLSVWDITSSYPNQIISYNLSPETILNSNEVPKEIRDLKENLQDIEGYIDIEELEKIAPVLKKYDLTLAANGEVFRRDKFGVFPEMVEKVFLGRKERKKEAGVLYGELQALKDRLKELESG
jgi:DNA polymerase elongation subunit (family B)